jgi:hypothetical protein
MAVRYLVRRKVGFDAFRSLLFVNVWYIALLGLLNDDLQCIKASTTVLNTPCGHAINPTQRTDNLYTCMLVSLCLVIIAAGAARLWADGSVPVQSRV